MENTNQNPSNQKNEKGKKKRGLQVFLTAIAYVLIVVVLLAIAPVLCPMPFGYRTYVVKADETGDFGDAFTLVYLKKSNGSLDYQNGNIIATLEGKGKVAVHYVESADTSALTFQDGSSAEASEVVGQIYAKTPIFGFLSQLCYSVIGIIILIVLFALGFSLMMYSNKIGKENNEIAAKEKEDRRK